MMKTVWTVCTIPLMWPVDHQVVHLAKGAQLLKVGWQATGEMQERGPLFLWARIDPGEEIVPYKICTCLTGDPLSTEAGAYLGSFKARDGALVYHAFGREI